jgi:hypothetical protein
MPVLHSPAFLTLTPWGMFGVPCSFSKSANVSESHPFDANNRSQLLTASGRDSHSAVPRQQFPHAGLTRSRAAAIWRSSNRSGAHGVGHIGLGSLAQGWLG